VEAVIQAHTRAFIEAGYPVTVIAGWGKKEAKTPEVSLVRIPEMDSQYSGVSQLSIQVAQHLASLTADQGIDHLGQVSRLRFVQCKL
jgi:hypothetical protein